MVVENMINQRRIYPDIAASDAKLDRPAGACIRFRVAVQASRNEMETAARPSAEAGFISPEGYEMVRLALLSNLGKASGPSD